MSFELDRVLHRHSAFQTIDLTLSKMSIDKKTQKTDYPFYIKFEKAHHFIIVSHNKRDINITRSANLLLSWPL